MEFPAYIPLIYRQLGDYIYNLPPIKGSSKLHGLHPQKTVQPSDRLAGTAASTTPALGLVKTMVRDRFHTRTEIPQGAMVL